MESAYYPSLDLSGDVHYLSDFMDQLETVAALERALEQSKRGEARDAKEVFEKMRAKYGIPRSLAA